MAKKETAEDLARKVKALNEEAKIKERMGLLSRLHMIAGFVSIVWIFYAVQYLVNSGWWSNRFAMSPPEFVGFISGMVLPLVLIWLMVAYIDRARQFQKDSQALQKYMEQLVSPTEDGADYTKALTDTLRVYIKDFKDVFAEVSASSGVVASDLRDRITELKLVQGDFKNDTERTVEELHNKASEIMTATKVVSENSKETVESLKWQIQSLNKASEDSSAAAHNMGTVAQDYVEKFNAVSKNLANQSESLTENLNNRTEMLYKASDITKDTLESFSMTLAEQVSIIEDTTDRVRSRTDNISMLFDEKSQRLEQVFIKQGQGLDNLVQKIDEKAIIVDESLKTQSEFLDTEIEKVISRFRLIEDGLSIQTGELVNASDKVIDNLNSTYGKLDEYKENLVSSADEISSRMQNLGHNYDERAEKLNTSALEIEGNIALTSKGLEDKFHSYSALADVLNERLTSMTVTTGKGIEDLRETIDSVGIVVDTVKEDIKKQGDDLIDMTNILESQSQMVEASLSQQQRAITATATKIDEVKVELKSHITELEGFYEKLDAQATGYLKKARNSMDKAHVDVGNLLKRTEEVTSAIDVELVKIEESNDRTLLSTNKIGEELGKHSKSMTDIMQSMQNRTNDIYKLFTSQKSVIENSAKDIQVKVGKISADFENALALLMRNARDAIAEVSDISNELQGRAEDIDGLFVKQEAILNNSSDRINDNSTRIMEIIRSNSTQLDTDLDRVRARISLIEDSLSNQVKDLINASEDSLMKVTALSEELAKQSDNVTSISRMSQDSLNHLLGNLEQQTSSVVTLIEGIEGKTMLSVETIGNKSKTLEDVMNSIGNKSQSIVSTIGEHIEVLDKGALKAQSQAQVIRNVLGQQIEDLTDVSNTVSTNIRLSEAAIVSQCKNLRQTADGTSEKIKEVGGLLKQNTADILGNVTRINKELEYIGDNVKNKADEASKIVDDTIAKAGEVSVTLEEQFKSLETMSESAIISVSSTVNQLKNNALSIEGASDSSIEQIKAVSDTLILQKMQMDKVTEEAVKSVKVLAQTVKDKADEFNSSTDGVERRIEGFINSIKDLAVEFEDISNNSVAKVDVTSSHLRSTITEVSSNSSRIANNVKDATNEFVKQSDELNQSAATAVAKLQSLLEAMRESSTEVEDVNDKLSANALKVGGALSRHIQALISASETAEEQVKKLDAKSLEVSHDAFLKEASFIIEKLQAVAVDISRVFQPNIEEELWKKYYNGDRAAFMRYLIKALDKHQVSSIRKLFENDKDFRDYVAGYMSNFEAILDRAKLSDRSDVIIAVLTGSDVGRLYMILARALGNKETA